VEVIKLVIAKNCAGCGQEIPAGAEAKYYSERRVYHHPACPKQATARKASSRTDEVIERLGQIHHDLERIIDLIERGKG